MILESTASFSRSREEAVVIWTKKSLGRTHPPCSQLNVGQVMSWLYTQPCHMTGPHWEGHSTHDSSAVKCAVLSVELHLLVETMVSDRSRLLVRVAGDEQHPSCCKQADLFALDGLLVSAGRSQDLQVCIDMKVLLLYQLPKTAASVFCKQGHMRFAMHSWKWFCTHNTAAGCLTVGNALACSEWFYTVSDYWLKCKYRQSVTHL